MSDDLKPPQETKTDMIATAKGLPPTEVFSLKPRTFDEAFRFANLIAESTLIPKDFQKNPANVLIAVQLGMELGVSPMQALQNIAVVNGRPTIWGDLLPAIVYASGYMEQFDEQGDEKQASCTVKRRGFPALTRTFTMEEAKKAIAYEWENGQRRTISLADKQTYKSYPKRMLQMRARAFAMRDAFPDVLKGVAIHEDTDSLPSEPRDVTPLRQPQAITEKKEDEPKRVDDSVPTGAGKERKTSSKGNRQAAHDRSTDEESSKTTTPTGIKEPESTPAEQAPKTQDEIIEELIFWVENCSSEDLLKEPENFLFAELKKVKGTLAQMKVLKPFNDRRQALAKAQ